MPSTTAVRITTISAAQNKRGKDCFEGGMETGAFTWFKDMGGNSNWMYIKVVNVSNQHVSLALWLLYEASTEPLVDPLTGSGSIQVGFFNQSKNLNRQVPLFELAEESKPGLEIGAGQSSTLKVRINDLSSHHQNQRFIIVIGPADAPIRGSRSVPIEIMSKPRVDSEAAAAQAQSAAASNSGGGGAAGGNSLGGGGANNNAAVALAGASSAAAALANQGASAGVVVVDGAALLGGGPGGSGQGSQALHHHHLGAGVGVPVASAPLAGAKRSLSDLSLAPTSLPVALGSKRQLTEADARSMTPASVISTLAAVTDPAPTRGRKLEIILALLSGLPRDELEELHGMISTKLQAASQEGLAGESAGKGGANAPTTTGDAPKAGAAPPQKPTTPSAAAAAEKEAAAKANSSSSTQQTTTQQRVTSSADNSRDSLGDSLGDRLGDSLGDRLGDRLGDSRDSLAAAADKKRLLLVGGHGGRHENGLGLGLSLTAAGEDTNETNDANHHTTNGTTTTTPLAIIPKKELPEPHHDVVPRVSSDSLGGSQPLEQHADATAPMDDDDDDAVDLDLDLAAAADSSRQPPRKKKFQPLVKAVLAFQKSARHAAEKAAETGDAQPTPDAPAWVANVLERFPPDESLNLTEEQLETFFQGNAEHTNLLDNVHQRTTQTRV
eukprot:CAMPEP_0118904898 /NCGR_PEP_ID=MMETSP1166-20130328/9176_1 /TAXON_ID=1104430 /ORGANISM="Chrysoreinhardia sp, Strain CCMP3193" /LENGTH=666 /DNA_ID=CAMNT_0006844165 /DNA_START=438 /DNA_END=2438 /DNA_ORIENTATION=-